MRSSIKREMLEYFKNISSPTPQENRFILYLQTDVELFDIIGLSRDDIYEKGFDADCVSDDQMGHLADKLADYYCNNGFWDDLECLLEDMGIPKLNEK